MSSSKKPLKISLGKHAVSSLKVNRIGYVFRNKTYNYKNNFIITLPQTSL
jgi:hypothetical protein